MKELISTEALVLHNENRPATELETKDILKQISVHQKHVHAVDEELQRLQRAIDDMTGLINKKSTKRKRHLDAIAFKNGLLAPIRKLPFEIIGEILFHVIEAPPYSSPLQLSRVCRYFKYVIDHTPKLWSRLHFKRCNEAKKVSAKAMPLSVAWKWLRNAGECPIAVTIEQGPYKFGEAPPPFHLVDVAGFLEILSGHRLRSIKFIAHNLNITNFSSFLSRLQLRSLVDLQSLEVQVPYDYWLEPRAPAPFTNIHDIFTAAPHLIQTISVPMTFLPLDCSIFSHVTGLTLMDREEDFLNRLCSLLSHCSSVQYLSIEYVGYMDEIMQTETSLSMPTVQELRTHGDSPLGSLFQRIRFPNLQFLQISRKYGTLKQLDTAVKQLIQTSNPPLAELSLVGSRFSETTLIWFLERLPDLERLHLKEIGVAHKFVDALVRTPTPRRRRVCPKLTCLDISQTTRLRVLDVTALLKARVHDARTEAKRGKRLSKKKQYLAPPMPLKSCILNGVEMIKDEIKLEFNEQTR
ncbi:hypothetical protein FRC03_008644 [Tulasnella sp. 419]|nr:hypothetical protein FRC03_008644 [Tulasnella sp. 419]